MIYGEQEYNFSDVKIPSINAINQSNNWYIYCSANPLSYIDPTGETYSNSIKEENGQYVVTTTVSNWFSTLTFEYTIKDSAVSFDFSDNNYWSALWRGLDDDLAKAIYYAAKSISSEYLSGRTIGGINTELQIHWAFYKAGVLSGKASPANIGGIDPNKPGFDRNAIFSKVLKPRKSKKS